MVYTVNKMCMIASCSSMKAGFSYACGILENLQSVVTVQWTAIQLPFSCKCMGFNSVTAYQPL